MNSHSTCKTCRFWQTGAEYGNCTVPFHEGAITGIMTFTSKAETIKTIKENVEDYLKNLDLSEIDTEDDIDIYDIVDTSELAGIVTEAFDDSTEIIGIRTRHDFGCNQHPDFERITGEFLYNASRATELLKPIFDRIQANKQPEITPAP